MRFLSKEYPKNKLSPCPLIETVAEIRFDSKLPSDVISGVFFGSVREEFPESQALSILELPKNIREADPYLKFNPHYQFSNSDFKLKIGPNNVVIESNSSYKGWATFSGTIKKIISKLDELKIVDKPIRLGLRYISKFNEKSLKLLNLSLKIADNDIADENTSIRTEFSLDDFLCLLHIHNIPASNNNQMEIQVDIDVIKNINEKETNFMKYFENAHQIEKKIFYNLATKKLLANYLKE